MLSMKEEMSLLMSKIIVTVVVVVVVECQRLDNVLVTVVGLMPSVGERRLPSSLITVVGE
jgi:hypothetical protein